MFIKEFTLDCSMPRCLVSIAVCVFCAYFIFPFRIFFFALRYKTIYFVTMLLIIMYLRKKNEREWQNIYYFLSWLWVDGYEGESRGCYVVWKKRYAMSEMNEVIIKLFTWLIEKHIAVVVPLSFFVTFWRKIISDYCCVTFSCRVCSTFVDVVVIIANNFLIPALLYMLSHRRLLIKREW